MKEKISITIDEKLLEQLKVKAEDENRNVSNLIETLVTSAVGNANQ